MDRFSCGLFSLLQVKTLLSPPLLLEIGHFPLLSLGCVGPFCSPLYTMQIVITVAQWSSAELLQKKKKKLFCVNTT